jgi:hypothetical protein
MFPSDSDCKRVAEHAANVLALQGAVLGEEYYYNSVTLCVIDAVFSIGGRYEGVRAVVRRYCERFELARFRPDRAALPEKNLQEAVSGLLLRFEEFEPPRMAAEVFKNRQRTAARSGILKAEAVKQFSSVLHAHGIQYLQDVDTRLPTEELEKEIGKIPGQKSGISLQYFWMLAGSDSLIKLSSDIRN